MLDDMDTGVKILVIILVVGVVLVLLVPLVIILAAVIASFVLGLGGETALLVPVCGPGLARRVRSRVAGTLAGRGKARASARAESGHRPGE